MSIKQKRKPVGVERDPYDGPVIELAQPIEDRHDNPIIPPSDSPDFYTRPPTRGGGRNLQDSSFQLSGITMAFPSYAHVPV